MGNWKVLTGPLEVVEGKLLEHLALSWTAKGGMTRAHASCNIWSQIVILSGKK
jgi:hypothetical protein